jgi:hypothetical protein
MSSSMAEWPSTKSEPVIPKRTPSRGGRLRPGQVEDEELAPIAGRR